ncbi:MAG: endolytic transglycosylase MltG [Candidatus Peregrinibacteria bacterium]|nr:endolytic transglycosylase MltG [Candidatus Peregrinibacteria bacterium]
MVFYSYNKNRRFYRFLGIPVIVAFVLLVLYIRYHSFVYDPVDPSDNTGISFQVKKGQSVKDIAGSLEQKGLIKSPLSLYIHAKLNHLGENIIAGRFVLTKAMNGPKILEALSDASKAQFVITVQEGLTIKDIDAKLVDMDLIKAGNFIQAVKSFDNWQGYLFLDKATLSKLDLPLEGYLYPDTYFLNPDGFRPNDLISMMLNNFEKKFSKLQENIKKHSIHQIITMASIIESEVKSSKDRKNVSGIFWKRLDAHWPLGADATLLYVTKDRTITGKDLAINSPYNTRKNQGLPPGPICSPSIDSIEAAMYPTTTAYWFYLTTLDTGKVIYAKTNEEQNLNRAKYLK